MNNILRHYLVFKACFFSNLFSKSMRLLKKDLQEISVALRISANYDADLFGKDQTLAFVLSETSLAEREFLLVVNRNS